MTLGLGLLADNLNPKQTGREYPVVGISKDFDDLRKDFTVVSGHLIQVSGRYRAESSLLSAAAMSAGIPSGNTIQSISCWLNILVTKHDFHHLFLAAWVVTVPRTQKMAQ